MTKEKAMFGAGCFWGVESAFMEIEGVKKTEVGYSGGDVENPTYRKVCFGDTGHAEVVYLEFDTKKISYEKLLDAFWNMHDPTQHNRQGPDVGSQYRSVIFYFTLEQKKKAEESKKKLEKTFKVKVATLIEKARPFYKAEEYHQKYNMKNGFKGCAVPGGLLGK